MYEESAFAVLNLTVSPQAIGISDDKIERNRKARLDMPNIRWVANPAGADG